VSCTIVIRRNTLIILLQCPNCHHAKLQTLAYEFADAEALLVRIQACQNKLYIPRPALDAPLRPAPQPIECPDKKLTAPILSALLNPTRHTPKATGTALATSVVIAAQVLEDDSLDKLRTHLVEWAIATHGMYESSQVCLASIGNSIWTLLSSQGCLVSE
jgi:hypothetical protein